MAAWKGGAKHFKEDPKLTPRKAYPLPCGFGMVSGWYFEMFESLGR